MPTKFEWMLSDRTDSETAGYQLRGGSVAIGDLLATERRCLGEER